jgi:hypothetical protein
MTDEALKDALTALNEVMAIYSLPQIKLTDDIASRIGWHINRHSPKTVKPAGRLPVGYGKRAEELDKASEDLAGFWQTHVDNEFVSCASNYWQILGLDKAGQLYARVINVEQRFVGKPVIFDKRMRPKPVRDSFTFDKILRDYKAVSSAAELRAEMGLTTEGLF